MASNERSAPRVLVLDSDAEHADELVEQLRDAGYEANARADWDERDATLDIDVILGEADTVALEDLAAACSPEDAPAWILLAAFGSIQDAVGAMRAGASDYISKPIPIDRLLMSLERALERRALLNQNQRLLEDLGRRYSLGDMQSTSDAMSSVFDTVRAVADTRATVLLEGESGTGKSLLARSLHEAGARRDGPFVVVNCGALPHDLLESELFGHVKGAFTGAVSDRPGKFELAEGGTLFLDEITCAPLDLQVKLLRLLQERTFERVGDTRTRTADVRVIAASNEDLKDAVQAGRFREDLYYRIKVVAVRLPSLRERAGDVPFLAQRFLDGFAKEHDRALDGYSSAALQALSAYAWPGNVRELENTIERAVLLARGPAITPGDLPEEVHPQDLAAPASPYLSENQSTEILPLRLALEAPEREILVSALLQTKGCRKATSEALAINRTTLFNKMRK
ncbi:MAG: sigma-54 dependent transcriptional regulator, partial [Planctomycetes bacterium]|nr:sigma-54 dependent transcriptional regulator [Planctomycetota bacterium]